MLKQCSIIKERHMMGACAGNHITDVGHQECEKPVGHIKMND